MAVLLCMLYIMLHGSAVYAPVTGRSILDCLGHQVSVVLHVDKDHLKPELAPAVVADC